MQLQQEIFWTWISASAPSPTSCISVLFQLAYPNLGSFCIPKCQCLPLLAWNRYKFTQSYSVLTLDMTEHLITDLLVLSLW